MKSYIVLEFMNKLGDLVATFSVDSDTPPEKRDNIFNLLCRLNECEQCLKLRYFFKTVDLYKMFLGVPGPAPQPKAETPPRLKNVLRLFQKQEEKGCVDIIVTVLALLLSAFYFAF